MFLNLLDRLPSDHISLSNLTFAVVYVVALQKPVSCR